MVLLFSIVALLLVAFCICYAGAWIYYKVFPSKEKHQNPYIQEHLSMLQNDRYYEEYLKFLDENNLDGVAIDKRLSKEEFEMKKELGLV